MTRRTMFQSIAAGALALFGRKVKANSPNFGPPGQTVHPETICPHCRRMGLKSVSRYDGSMFRERWKSDGFYDSEGRSHYHDSRELQPRHKCSRGHTWLSPAGPIGCWCGWPEKGPFPADYSVPMPKWADSDTRWKRAKK